jgi:hypothetical protein
VRTKERGIVVTPTKERRNDIAAAGEYLEAFGVLFRNPGASALTGCTTLPYATPYSVLRTSPPTIAPVFCGWRRFRPVGAVSKTRPNLFRLSLTHLAERGYSIIIHHPHQTARSGQTTSVAELLGAQCLRSSLALLRSSLLSGVLSYYGVLCTYTNSQVRYLECMKWMLRRAGSKRLAYG